MIANGGSASAGGGPPGASRDPSGSPPAPPAPLVRFAELFHAGRYWDSHEVLEGPWRENGSELYHGLILAASAWVHVRRGNPHGIDAQLRKALRALEGLPDAYLGIDLAALRDAARAGRRTVRARRHDPSVRWAEAVPPPRLDLHPGRVRGDEPELEPTRRSRG